MAITLQDQLSQEQIDQINARTNDRTQNFYAAYRYIADEIAAGRLIVDERTRIWFEGAEQINANEADKAANIFVRSVTRYGLLWDQQPAGDAKLDLISQRIPKIEVPVGVPVEFR